MSPAIDFEATSADGIRRTHDHVVPFRNDLQDARVDPWRDARSRQAVTPICQLRKSQPGPPSSGFFRVERGACTAASFGRNMRAMSIAPPLRRLARRFRLALAAVDLAITATIRRDRAVRLVARSGLFDPADHARRHRLPPFADETTAIRHRLRRGPGDGPVAPGDFDAAFYRRQIAGRLLAAADPLLHYILVGSRLGLAPAADFDPAHYRRDNPDVGLARWEPFGHWRRFGRAEGRDLDAAVEPPPIVPLPAAPRPVAAEGAAARPIDVIVPVYRGLDDMRRTLHSVLAATGATPFELVVIDDASPEPAVSADLGALAAAGHITLLRNPANLGFVGSVNRGLALHPERDVVLLNADTAVFDGWLDRLVAHLRLPRVGSVTALSNAATIFSYPVRLRDNPKAVEIPFADLDRLAAALPVVAPIEVPTGVGFCMAIARAALDEVGPLDEANFGRGYGEENDLCCRMTARGWRHLAAPDTFVWHRGGGAFGPEKLARVAAAQATLARLHPSYAGAVARFLRDDPLAPVRLALDLARLARDPRRKRLVFRAATAETGGDDLVLRLVGDIGPHHGALRIIAEDFGPLPNLPRLARGATVEAIAAILAPLRLAAIAVDPDAPAAPVWADRLRAAAARLGIAQELAPARVE